MANCRRTKGPSYRVEQRVWVLTGDLPLRTDYRKLAHRFIGPFPVSKIINPVAIQLKLPRFMKIHPTFHVSKVKSHVESPLVPAMATPPPPHIIEGEPANTVKTLLAVYRMG